MSESDSFAHPCIVGFMRLTALFFLGILIVAPTAHAQLVAYDDQRGK